MLTMQKAILMFISTDDHKQPKNTCERLSFRLSFRS